MVSMTGDKFFFLFLFFTGLHSCWNKKKAVSYDSSLNLFTIFSRSNLPHMVSLALRLLWFMTTVQELSLFSTI